MPIMGDGNDLLKIYVRLPTKIKEELEIKNLHPDIKVVQIPRQKSRRWCFVVFQDKEVCDKVVEYLKSIRIDNKKIVVRPFKHRTSRKLTGNKDLQARIKLLEN